MTKLLCSFVEKNNILNFLKDVDNTYSILNGEIEVYTLDINFEYLCVYEIENIRRDLPRRSMIVHKKTHTNTFYTINAINAIIREMNNGVLDKSVQIPWENYADSLIITDGRNLVQKSIYYKETIK